jgi:hypothetical protein
MEYSINEKTVEAVLTSVNLETKIDGGNLDVVIGDAAKMDVAEALNYIKSGEAELMPLVIRAEDAAEKSEMYANTFIFEQAIASDTWIIEHNQDKYPSVTIVDSAGNVFTPAVHYDSENQITVTMNGATTGKAYLN